MLAIFSQLYVVERINNCLYKIKKSKKFQEQYTRSFFTARENNNSET